MSFMHEFLSKSIQGWVLLFFFKSNSQVNDDNNETNEHDKASKKREKSNIGRIWISKCVNYGYSEESHVELKENSYCVLVNKA